MTHARTPSQQLALLEKTLSTMTKKQAQRWRRRYEDARAECNIVDAVDHVLFQIHNERISLR